MYILQKLKDEIAICSIQLYVRLIAIYDLTIILHIDIMLRRTFPDISISKYLIKSKQINHYVSRLQWFMVVIQMIIVLPIADKWLKPTHTCITYWLRYKKSC